MNTTPPIDAVAIGRLVPELQKPPHEIRKAAEQLGILPVLVLNGVPHYATADTDRLGAALWGEVEFRSKVRPNG
ncbi:MAG: hypothetical protein AAGJ46_06640 [Planctomycetota bacterium]